MQNAEPQAPIQLIVGLANPGKEYINTRHNAGAWFIDALTQQTHACLRFEAKYHGLHAAIKIHGHTCHVLIPTTFMNLSGQAVSACIKYNKMTTNSLLIAHDDIDLPAGSIKLKFDGGDGGHNGLKNIIRHLNTKQFYRLRIGVGRPAPQTDVVDYVLHPPSKADREKINFALQEAQNTLPFIIAGNMQQAMQSLHTKK